MTKDGLFEIIKRCHERVGHSGREKTWREVHSNYSWVRYDAISLFLQTCTQCSLRKPLKNRPCGKPIISLGFLTRCQVDLIGMSSRPDQDFKWIFHMRDHFSKFSLAYPLVSKRASAELHAARNFVTAARPAARYFSKSSPQPGPRPAVLLNSTRSPQQAREYPEHLFRHTNLCAP